MTRKALVKVPASTANLGPGFDCLGMALNLYAWLEISVSDQTRFHLYGENLNGLPVDESNLVFQVVQRLFDEAGARREHLEISMYSDIPLTRGLGSSASTIVGALAGANALLGHPFSGMDLFRIAAGLERHPDNVGASLFGGIVATSWDGERADYIRIEPDPRLEVLAAIPKFQLSTEKAREALPARVPLKDAVFNVSRASMLVAAFVTGNLPKIGEAMKDALHQPYRSALVPGMPEILEKACAHGALGAALSGAGPTLIALADNTLGRNKRELEKFLTQSFRDAGIEAETIWLKPSGDGAIELTPPAENSTFIENVKGEVRA